MSTLSQELPTTVHSKGRSDSHRQSVGVDSHLPGALAAVSSVWFAMELAARLWGHPGGSGEVGLEPFAILAVAVGSGAVALRNHLRRR